MITRLKILFLKWQIRLLLKQYHLSKNPIGGGRRKKEKPIEADYKAFDVNTIAEEMGHESPLDDDGKEGVNGQIT